MSKRHHDAAHHTNPPEDMDRPELIALVKMLRTQLETAKSNDEERNQRLHEVMALREDYKLQEEQLRPQVESLKAQLAAMTADRDSEQDLRLSLEEQIDTDLKAAQKAMGHAALRMLSLLDRISPD